MKNNNQIEGTLEERRRSDLRLNIAGYAVETAGSGSDLDEALVRAAVEMLLHDMPVRRVRAKKT